MGIVNFEFIVGVGMPTLGIAILVWVIIRICDIDWWLRNLYRSYRNTNRKTGRTDD